MKKTGREMMGHNAILPGLFAIQITETEHHPTQFLSNVDNVFIYHESIVVFSKYVGLFKYL